MNNNTTITYNYQVRWRFLGGECGTSDLHCQASQSIAEIHKQTLADIRRIIGWQVPRDFVEFLSIRTRIIKLDAPFLHRKTWGAELHYNGKLFLWNNNDRNVVRFNGTQALQLYNLLRRNLGIIRQSIEYDERES